MTNAIITRAVGGAAIVLAAFMAAMMVGVGNLRVAVFLLLALLGLTAVARPTLLTVSFLIVSSAGLTLPQLGGQLTLAHLCAACMGGAAVVLFAMGRRPNVRWGMAHWLLLAFFAVVLVTGLARGLGFQALGSDKVGGMRYITLFVSASLFFSMPFLNLPRRWWRPVLIVAALATSVAVVLELARTLAPSVGLILSMFVIGHSQEMTGRLGELTRFFSFQGFGQAIMTIPLMLRPMGEILSRRGLPLLLVVILGLGLTTLSGFRSSMLRSVVLVVVLMVMNRAFTPGRLLIFAASGVLGYATAMVAAKSLPESIQRTLAILPGVEVQPWVRFDANVTIDWRLEVWERALKQVQQYFVLGRGFAVNINEFLFVMDERSQLYDPVNYAFATGDLHNGPLGLVFNLGLAGLVTGLGFMAAVAWRHLRFQRGEWADPTIYLLHQLMAAQLLVSFVFFVLVYGDVHKSFPGVLMYAAIAECLVLVGYKGPRSLAGEQATEEFRPESQEKSLTPMGTAPNLG